MKLFLSTSGSLSRSEGILGARPLGRLREPQYAMESEDKLVEGFFRAPTSTNAWQWCHTPRTDNLYASHPMDVKVGSPPFVTASKRARSTQG